MPTTRHTPAEITELAEFVRLHNVSELDLRDAATDVDNQLFATNDVDGDPHLILALAASLLNQTAWDTLQDLFAYLGWECGHGVTLLSGHCPTCD